MAGLSLPTPSWAPGQLHSLLRVVQGPQQEGQSQDEHFSFFSPESLYPFTNLSLFLHLLALPTTSLLCYWARDFLFVLRVHR